MTQAMQMAHQVHQMQQQIAVQHHQALMAVQSQQLQRQQAPSQQPLSKIAKRALYKQRIAERKERLSARKSGVDGQTATTSKRERNL